MDVILHIGAHRTATTSFQGYMRANMPSFHDMGVSFWGPPRTRGGLFHGLSPLRGRMDLKAQDRAVGRVRLALDAVERRGVRTLLVSDENMIGTPRLNLRDERLYQGAAERLARFLHAFEGRVTQILLTVRALDTFWASSIGFAVPRGLPLPDADMLDRLVTQPRSWRDVATEAHVASGGLPVMVAPFETYAGRPDALARQALGLSGPLPIDDRHAWRNRGPSIDDLRMVLEDRADTRSLAPREGRWMPFDPDQQAALQETYADDLFWLHGGAGDIARILEEPKPAAAGQHARAGGIKRGHFDDERQRAMG